MKTFMLLLGMLMAAGVVMASVAAFGAASNEPAGYGPLLADAYSNSDNIARTCSGDEVGLTARQYLFGFQRSDGFCAARLFYANSSGEAESCAELYCKNCEIEDITNKYLFTTSVPGVSDPINFCPARR